MGRAQGARFFWAVLRDFNIPYLGAIHTPARNFPRSAGVPVVPSLFCGFFQAESKPLLLRADWAIGDDTSERYTSTFTFSKTMLTWSSPLFHKSWTPRKALLQHLSNTKNMITNLPSRDIVPQALNPKQYTMTPTPWAYTLCPKL